MKNLRLYLQQTTKILTALYALIFILLSNVVVFSQTIEFGWKGIEPLKTSKVAVNKILGTPEIDDNDYHGYTTDEGFVQVNYSTVPCKDDQYKRGKYNIAQDTVLDYIVNLKEAIKLSEFKYKREKYIKDTSGCLLNSALYINEADGIWFNVYIQEEIEYVTKIYYKQNKQDAESLKCKEKL